MSRRLDIPLHVELDLHEWVPDRTQSWTDGDVVRAAYEEMHLLAGEWPDGEERSWEPLSAVRSRVEDVLASYAGDDLVAVVCHSVVIEAVLGRTAVEPGGVVWPE